MKCYIREEEGRMSAGKAAVAELEISEEAKKAIEKIKDPETTELSCEWK